MSPSLPELPEEFTALLAQVVPVARHKQVMASFAAVKPVTFRANTIKTSAAQLRAELEQAGFAPRPISWCPEAFALAHEAKRALTETPAFYEGRLYIQNLASMLAPLALDPQPGETVLDLAAAPGGKASQIAALMGNEGRLSVVEAIKPRFFRLKANLDQQGVAIARAFLMDGRLVGRKCPQMFDRILLDAPCSSEARFTRLDPQSWGHWSPRKVKETARKQKGLIAAAWTALKPGGTLVYCTCSFSPEENEKIVHNLLRRNEDAVIVPWTPAIDNLQAGLTSWQGKELRPEVANTLRVLPDGMMDGFYLAKIRKAD
ncbi:16S rRNA (cytosine1407-C5)-methyltransferase [Geoalkalibacter ferrihydriticus]|uniref:rRNA cytosine-C5-methyltransferase n=2 Tax=Geoalkalibacter ferrihydriticus TaxID=392333 RepID=A0A0C2HHL9_9BACT|nr:RsmB/NOP family class I SAM-dependent RNA methyltransferase [Geoalkalibacter ferrihydriticus]KIH76491.1 rRNA cytosine-C5-methyltransferase [Geoalkalibacter ferrihydriticus DSM 17813]SDL98012.1 16S rRNA (cytosine1407-C5)-methyltransferase [Geoalkalibacter ferrihydriticus]